VTYNPIPINGERTIGALMSMVQQADKRSHDRHAETVSELLSVKEAAVALTGRVAAVEDECKRRPELCALKWQLADRDPAWNGQERRHGPTDDSRTWVMWGVGKMLLERVVLPLIVAAGATLITLAATGVIGG
jgi:hypothetical protein